MDDILKKGLDFWKKDWMKDLCTTMSIIAVATVLTTVFEIPSTPLMIPRFEGVSWYD